MRGVEHRAFTCGVQQFARERGGERWDLVQSTFALQSLPPSERADVLRWIAEHTDRFVLVEFDVPEVEDSLERCGSVTAFRGWSGGCGSTPRTAIWWGLGFILPVVLGHFVDSARTNYEFSIDSWGAELRRAGFDEVFSTRLYGYWWEPAYLVEAQVNR